MQEGGNDERASPAVAKQHEAEKPKAQASGGTAATSLAPQNASSSEDAVAILKGANDRVRSFFKTRRVRPVRRTDRLRGLRSR